MTVATPGPQRAISRPPASEPIRPLAASLAAAASGFAVMSLELAAVRMFAPHFGDSAFVWTNVIGVMLLALAIGATVGGRLADGSRHGHRLARALIAAGLYAAVVPLLGGTLGSFLLPDDLALDRASGVLVRGSLVATLVAFAPPALLAGVATPLLVSGLAHGPSGLRVGRASGLVATWGTIGSLVGTFATTHVLVPEIGSRATVWTCAALLVAAGLAVAPSLRAALLLLVPIGLAAVPQGPLRPVEPPEELLAEAESRYQYLQVVRAPEGDTTATSLKINEGLDSFHSVRLAGTPWTAGRYYDWHAVMPLLAGDGARPDPLRVLSLGAAAGTFERVFAAAHDGVVVDSVEIDPAVVALGREHFAAFADGGRVWSGLDARVFVERGDARWDVVLVDAYERQVYLPAHVASVEFFTAVRDRLEPKGVVSVNVGGRNFDDPVVQVVGATLAEVFDEAWAFRVPRSRNFVLAARHGAPIDPAVLDPAPGGAAAAATDDPVLRDMLAAMARREAWQRFARGDGPVLTDDRPFLDTAQDAALSREIADPQPVEIAGSREPGEVEAVAFEAAQIGAFEQVLALARTARTASGYLRFLLGDARWSLHDVAGAVAEYEAAERLGVDARLAEVLAARLSGARVELAQVERSERIAARNGWLALLGAAWLGVAAFASTRLLRGSAA